MKIIEVNTGTPYKVALERGALDRLGESASALTKAKRAMIVSDTNVAPLYLERAKRSLEACEIEVCTFITSAGEISKSTENLVRLWEALAESEITRSDLVVALGGGVVGDLAGFAASSFLRGIKYIQIPTTLLAMTDSSVGGKTAVDLKAGKNLAGAFYQPCHVICDPDTLKTLSAESLRDGMAEVIKYAMINRPALAEMLTRYDGAEDMLDEIIAICIEDKRDIVSRDEFDLGERALLNFGHTPAHAIELCSDFSVTHGSAVAIGMVIMTRAAVKMGLCDEKALDTLLCLLCKFGLPTETGFGASILARGALGDKKRSGDSVSIIMPYGVGDARICKVNLAELEEIFLKGIEK